jgi:hypothetical protein
MVRGQGEVRKIASLVGAALALGAGAASTVHAQTFAAGASSTDGDHTNFELGVTLRHDTNVGHTSAEGLAKRRITPVDDHFSPDALLDIQRMLGRHKFGIQADGGYDFYRYNTRLNRERVHVGLSGEIDLSVCNVTLTSDYRRTQTDMANLTATGDQTLVNNLESKTSAGEEMSCGGEIGVRPMMGFNVEKAVNSSAQRKSADRDTKSYSSGLAYVHPSIGTLMAFGSLRQTRFAHAILSNGEHNGFDVKAIGGRFSRNTGARLKGSFEVTYAALSPRLAGGRSFSGLNWSTDLTFDVSSRMQAHALLAREITAGAVADTAYHIDTTYGLDLNYVLNDKLKLSASGSYMPRSFAGSQGANGVALTSDRLYTATTTLSYAMNDRLQFTLGGGYEGRHANVAFYNYHSINVQTGVRLKL